MGTPKGFPNPPAMSAGQQSWPTLTRSMDSQQRYFVGRRGTIMCA